MKLNFKNFDWGLFLSMFLLLSLGILVIFSTSPKVAASQILYAGGGLLLYFALLFFDYKILKNLAPLLYLAALVLLALTLFKGITTAGAIRWLTLGKLTLQPSEVAKLALVVTLSSFFVSKFWQGSSLVAFSFSLLLALVPMALVFFQPDLGTAIILFTIWLGMVYAAKVRPFFLFSLTGLFGVLSLPIWLFLKSYQRERVLTFLNPTLDPLGRGYHVIQSMIAVGSGRFFGRGFGRGTQSHLQFLPAYHTDFIFATFAEEWGFFGSMLLLLLFALLFWRILEIAKGASNDFGFLIAVGVFSMLFFQTTINIGMNLGLAPITGIPLPLISSGGSSLVTTLAALGLVQSVAMRRGM